MRIKYHLPRTGISPAAHAPRRLRGKSTGVVRLLKDRARRGERAVWIDVLDLRIDGAPVYIAQDYKGRSFRCDKAGNTLNCPTGQIRRAIAKD